MKGGVETSATVQGEPCLAHNVVPRLVASITMDNFFSNIPLFTKLLEKGTYATGTIWCNWVGLPIIEYQ